MITLDNFGTERVKIINPVKFQPVNNFGRGAVLPHHENFARKLCKIHWITEQTWLWSGNGIMDAQTPKIIAGWISQWVYVEQYPWPFITSSSGVMDTITVSSSLTSIYSTIPPATKSCQLGRNKCYYFSLMYLFIALNKVLFSINERVGHLGGKEVNREFRHRRFLACEQALRGGSGALWRQGGKRKEGLQLLTIALRSFAHGSCNFREAKFKDFSSTNFSF